MNRHFPPNDPMLSTEEIAERTGFTPRFWENRRLIGNTPPFIKLGARSIRYRWSDVEQWLADHIRTSESDMPKK